MSDFAAPSGPPPPKVPEGWKGKSYRIALHQFKNRAGLSFLPRLLS